jgi:hypothetical protein
LPKITTPLALTLLALACACASAQAQGAPNSRGSGITYGSVKSVDAAKRRIALINARPGARTREVAVRTDAVLVRMSLARKADLKVGDKVSLTGVPLRIEARQIRIGDEPPSAPPRSQGGAPAPGRSAGQPGPSAQVYGRVNRITPLMISLSNGLLVEVRTSPQTRFMKLVATTIGQIKPGEPVMVYGRPGSDGTVDAHRMQVGFMGMPFSRPKPAPR